MPSPTDTQSSRSQSVSVESRWDKGAIEAEVDTVLLAITGMSPAVLTETVWALAQGPEPVIPDRIIVVTTAAGRRQLDRLFEPVNGWQGDCPWQALRRAMVAAGYDIEGRLRFGLTGDDVRVITAADPATGISKELTDIRSPQDNTATADFMLDQVRSLTANPDIRVVASLAGGRKTMGALLYACFTLAGRETDRLTHVLVSEPYEALSGFWFPGQPGGALHAKSGGSVLEYEPSRAILELADVPFVPLRNLFQRELGRAVGAFGRLMDTCRSGIRQRAGEHLQMTVHTRRCELDLNTRTLPLPAREHALLLFLSHHAKHDRVPYLAGKDAINPLNDYCRELRKSMSEGASTDPRLLEALNRPWTDDQELRRTVSDLRRRLRQWGNDGACLADLLPGRGRFALDLKGAQIFLR